MGLVNPSQSSPGDTIEAADVNTPVNQLASVINGNIDQNNIAASGVGTTQLADSSVSDSKLQARFSEVLSDFIASGGVVAQSAGLVGTFSNIVYYISGVRYTATSVPNKTYTASKDTYVDINSSGSPTYTEVANGAASPALTSGYIRVAKVVTNGSAITSVVQTASDSLGNFIYPTNPTGNNAWKLYTPTWTMNGASNNGTKTGGYIQTGKTVHFWAKFVVDGTSNFTGLTSVFCGLPVAASSAFDAATEGAFIRGVCKVGASYFPLTCLGGGATSVQLTLWNTTTSYGTLTDITATIPASWGIGDSIFVNGTYEAA